MIRVLCLTATVVFAQTAVVPFVGCPSDGQLGPEPPPAGRGRTIQGNAAIAKQLAHYETAQKIGVLAPRGWHCFGTYGSGGMSVMVSPTPIDAANWFTEKGPSGFAGPAVHLSARYGWSGRFEVAEIISRVFPSRRSFAELVQQVEPSVSLPQMPYPNDALTYRSSTVVEFETPPDTEGLGTRSRLLKNNAPISGVAILVDRQDVPDLRILALRLPPGLERLTEVIVRQVEAESARQGK